MAPSSQPSSRPLLQGTFGGISLFSLLLLILGLAMAALQIMILADKIPLEPETADLLQKRPYSPGIIAGISLLLFYFLALRRGRFSLYTDRLEGRTKGGRLFNIPIGEIQRVRLESSTLVIYGEQRRPLLVQSNPHPKSLKGLLWLLSAYGEERIPQAVWWKLDPEQKDLSGDLQAGLRLFLDGEGREAFIDAGVALDRGGKIFFFPYSDTVYRLSEADRKSSIAQASRQRGLILKFDPNPAELPIVAFLSAILKVDLGESKEVEILESLLEKHGGCFLSEAPGDPESYVGEIDGWEVRWAEIP